LILAVAEPPEEWTGVVQHIRVFTIEADTRLDRQFFQRPRSRLQDVFHASKAMGGRDHPEAQDAILRITSRSKGAALKSRATGLLLSSTWGRPKKNR